MANVTVSTNPSTTNNILTVNFTTDVNNITDVQLTKDGSNYISATSFTSTSASFDVASWSNGTYNNCCLKVIYTETSAPATYTITRNVTNCTSTGGSSIDTSITTTFQSVVAPNNGYILETLTVSMGGVDYTDRPNVITDMEWNGKPAKQITIKNVNGDIVITASAIQQSTPPTGGGSGGDTGGDTGGDSGELTYTSAVSEDFTTVGECSGISIDSSNNLVASTLDKFGMVKLNKPVRKLQFNVRDNQADHGALCWYIYNTYKDGAMDKYNMIALSNVADGENGKLFNMAIPGVYKQEIDKLDIPAINPGEQLTIEITDSAPTTKQYKDERTNDTVMTTEIITTHTIKRADGTILATLTGNMSAWCGQSTNSSPFCSNIQYVPEVVYDNPSYSVKDYKITLSQDGYSEVFDANNHIYNVYCENFKDFVWEGENYALALFRGSTGSKFRINGMCPSAFGYRVLNKENSTEPYDLLDDAYVPTVNNFNFSVGFRNGDLEHQHQVDTSLLEECISTLNCALPAFNYSVDSTSRNSVVVDEYNETWYGLSMTVDDHYEIKINQTNLIDNYGTLNSSTVNYRAWKSTLVHELGHSLGFDDNAAHFPTLYTYRRTRPEVYYLQAPDIYTLKSLYKEKYNIDISKSQEDINAQVAALGLGTHTSTDKPSGRILSVHFDYPAYTNNELYDKSDLIIEGKLEFDRCESVNIGSENSPLVLKYNIYKIIPNSVIKGEITNYELKIHVSENIDIGANNTYKLYLKQFENVPCSLINIEQGIQVKE